MEESWPDVGEADGENGYAYLCASERLRSMSKQMFSRAAPELGRTLLGRRQGLCWDLMLLF